jgi:hypothetical protein
VFCRLKIQFRNKLPEILGLFFRHQGWHCLFVIQWNPPGI